jgi:hypothetical protein
MAAESTEKDWFVRGFWAVAAFSVVAAGVALVRGSWLAGAAQLSLGAVMALLASTLTRPTSSRILLIAAAMSAVVVVLGTLSLVISVQGN